MIRGEIRLSNVYGRVVPVRYEYYPETDTFKLITNPNFCEFSADTANLCPDAVKTLIHQDLNSWGASYTPEYVPEFFGGAAA